MSVQHAAASLRPIRRLLAALIIAALPGCATLPPSMSNALGRIPVISLLIDGARIEDMATRYADGSFTETEARAIASHDLPSPPGISHDLAALRRAMASLLAGNLEGALAAAMAVVRYGVSEELKVTGLVLAANVEMARGRFQTAARYMATAERRWMPLAQAARVQNRPVPKYEFGTHISVARLAGQFDEAERLLKAYAQWRTHYRKTSMLADLTSDADLAREQSEYLATIGNTEVAYSTASAGLNSFRAGVAAARNPSAFEAAAAHDKQESLLRLLIRISLQQAHFARAAQHLDELRLTVEANGNKRLSAWALQDVTAQVLAFAGEYKPAVTRLDEAWQLAPAAMRNSKAAALQRSSFKGMVLAMSGDWRGAHATLTEAGASSGVEDSILRDVHRAGLVAASAMIDRFDPPPESLEGRDRRYLGHLTSEHALLHFGVKVIAYERRGARRSSLADHIAAVKNGRAYSRGLRALQLSGELRSLPMFERYALYVKESYVAAASAALGRGGVDEADLLDAVTLLQRTETDDDIVAAATRQRLVAGVTAVQLRELQDLRQAARTAQRQLMAYGGSLEADAQRAADLGKMALVASDRLLTFVRTLRQTAPRLYDALGPDALTVGQLQARLDPEQALASISVLKDRTHVLLLTRAGVHQRIVPLTRDEVRALVDRIRETTTFEPESNGPPPEFDAAAAHLVHEHLFGWAAEPMRPVRHLSVVSSDALAAIPFGLLVQRPSLQTQLGGNASAAWLIKSMAVSHMPSLASWSAVASRPWNADGATFVAWADPTFRRGPPSAASQSDRGPHKPLRHPGPLSLIDAARLPSDLGARLARLPNTRQEAEAIALALGASPGDDVIAGDRATRSSVLALSRSGALKRKSVVMFATHGLMPAQVSGLAQPALVLAQELGESLPSLLSLEDVVSLDLAADWVLLSACNTSSAERVDGDPLSGLARGFFFAGASSLLLTHWAVETESAAAITTMTIRHLARNPRLNRAQALQRTAIEMIEARSTPSRWSHPAYWAPYALVGSSAR
jgi:CHAT domain-containing protein